MVQYFENQGKKAKGRGVEQGNAKTQDPKERRSHGMNRTELKRNTCHSFKNLAFSNHILKQLENP